jgi:hypothetical protein
MLVLIPAAALLAAVCYILASRNLATDVEMAPN